MAQTVYERVLAAFHHPSHNPPYFKSIITLHKAPLSSLYLHRQLPNKALLKTKNNEFPSSIGVQTVAQFTK